MTAPKAPVSVIVITRNEERNIEACLRSVAWAGEVVVVDAESVDGTREIAERLGAKVFCRPWEGFAAAKTFAVAQTANAWILWLDADERVTEELASEIVTLVHAAPPESAFAVARRAYFLGRWIRHCGWYPGYVVRLFRKEKARFAAPRVHEHLTVDGPAGRLRHDLLHYTDETLYHYLKKLNRYTTLAAGDRAEQGKKFRLSDLLVRPPLTFLRMYLLRLGFLDGRHGLVLSLHSAAYVFVKYAKLWERQSRPEGTGS